MKITNSRMALLINVLVMLIALLFIQQAFGQQTIAYKYDDLYRLIKATYPNGTVVRYEYDAVGNRTKKSVMLDVDDDVLPDDWEQQIVDADPGDDITKIQDVLPEDDYDNDTLSNADEFSRGTSPIKKDTDNDGLDDNEELIAGTDPKDPSSVFAVKSINKEPTSSITIIWNTISGKNYAIYYSNDAMSNEMVWTLAEDNIPASGIGTNTWTDDGTKTNPVPATVSKRYYKILVRAE